MEEEQEEVERDPSDDDEFRDYFALTSPLALIAVMTPSLLQMIRSLTSPRCTEDRDKSRKTGIGWEPRAFLTRYTRVHERKHDRVRFLFLDSMTGDLLYCFSSISDLIGREDMPKFTSGERAKFGVEVAKESARNEKIAKNEKITKKSLKAKSRAYAYALPCLGCHVLAGTGPYAKKEERKLEEQKGRKLEHSARAPWRLTPRRPEQQPWSSSSTPRRGHQCLGVPSPPQGQVTHA
ncbi:hypothetical protein PIB30_095999 [Stylosanthes scabra]|uniref:Uncharacterized protein n=1 Tax=Stylosanthes scabra TaxID=79078 RepID=A0ABU6ZUM2_9FABA|nr:hypothetical protein [Stylosanthes scabra]